MASKRRGWMKWASVSTVVIAIIAIIVYVAYGKKLGLDKTMKNVADKLPGSDTTSLPPTNG